MKKFQFFVCLIALLFIQFNILAQEQLIYMYISQTANNEIFLNYLDVKTLELNRSVEIINPTLDSELIISVSPDNRWIAIIPTNPTLAEAIQLYDVSSNQTQQIDIMIPTQIFTEWYPLLGPFRNLRWSPNSQYLGFISQTSSDFSVNVYDVTLSQQMLVTTSPQIGHLAWSNNNLLNVTSISCSNCPPQVETYDVENGTIIGSTQILDNLFSGLTQDICNLEASPNGTHFSFASVCGPSSLGTHKEIWIGDRQTSQIANVTNLTDEGFFMTDPPDENFVGRVAEYTTSWIDDFELLISAYYVRDTPTNPVVETFKYDLSSSELVSLGEVQSVELASNPVSDLIALSIYTVYSLPTDVRIVSSNDLQSLTSAMTYPAGCQLSWHSEGQWLGYSTQNNISRYCNKVIDGLVFVNPFQDIVSQYSFADDENNYAVGWIPEFENLAK